MQKQSLIPNQNIPYSVRVSRRARRLRIAVNCDSSVVVTRPYGFSERLMENFISQKMTWIQKSLNYFKRLGNSPVVKPTRREYEKNKLMALELAQAKVEYWNRFYNFSYNRVSVKNQKTRWGSCSKKGNLNFNYKIIHLPEKLADYLVVHELCHLQQLNHSQNFWRLVGQTIPDYKNLRKQLRNFRMLPVEAKP